MIIYEIPATKGSDNVELFCVEKDGVPFDLDVAGVTRIDAYVCDCGIASMTESDGHRISSDEGEITWLSDEITTNFGAFNLVAGVYSVKIEIFSPTYPNGFVVLGEGYNTAIRMMVSC